ncbi:MAG: hypothetical protein L0170_11070, partial [Acidobacteria bacterium]|nr:hypothetical protein [Acidobacteriota bacterium]
MRSASWKQHPSRGSLVGSFIAFGLFGLLAVLLGSRLFHPATVEASTAGESSGIASALTLARYQSIFAAVLEDRCTVTELHDLCLESIGSISSAQSHIDARGDVVSNLYAPSGMSCKLIISHRVQSRPFSEYHIRIEGPPGSDARNVASHSFLDLSYGFTESGSPTFVLCGVCDEIPQTQEAFEWLQSKGSTQVGAVYRCGEQGSQWQEIRRAATDSDEDGMAEWRLELHDPVS